MGMWGVFGVGFVVVGLICLGWVCVMSWGGVGENGVNEIKRE